MKETDKVTTQYLTNITGDPFADTGGLVIKYLWTLPHLKDRDISGLIDFAANLYVNKWGGKLHAFFLNSKITQAAFAGQRKIDEALKYYKALIDETEKHQEGYCRISGRKTKLFSAGRDNHILSGSGTFINFHHNFESGLYLSKEILIRIFFVPLGLVQLNDKVAMLSSNHEKVTAFFVERNCIENLKAFSSGTSEGVLRSKFNNPANALFSFADEYLSLNLKTLLESNEDEELFNKADITLNLYHFTNFGASPEVVIYVLESKVFKFYAFCNRIKIKKDWNKFLRNNYRNSKYKGATFNEDKEVWDSKSETIDFETYKIWKNSVLENLLAGRSILGNILYWNIKHSFPFIIVEKYQTVIKNMEKRTIDKIKQIADFVVIDRETDFITKSIKRLNGEKSAHGLRQLFVKLNSENYLKEAENPLITVQDYAEYLFPDGGNWREVRDVLLIAIYEKLHETDKVVPIPILEDEENESPILN
ncbi:type I-B CRISPR-associated protein Cas8b1/Cst1 [uncultured Mucilaginibacter sp.]|uniref:type I-B CRISPR-associated protein Cas8b1/Cst1 n=1 Tax=uncultured Mucilaginibacter sp. TaxID=797541 RepID=UPI00260D5C6E|nr:type I-B CRISPR-associated protein Cas8b1/Cst1 [uncultured Mucilaginibacter sp.]